MKKSFTAILCISISIILLFCSCASGNSSKQDVTQSPHDSDSSFKAAIVQFENDQLTNETRQAFIKRMRTLGYDEAKMKFDIKNAQGKTERLSEIVGSLNEAEYDIVITISDIATNAVKDSNCTIPTVFIGVGDPIALGVSSSTEALKNMTGTISNTSVDTVLSFIRILTPDVSNVGIICMNNEKSIAEKDAVKEYLTNDIFGVEEAILDGTDGIAEFVSQMLTRTDAVYITADRELADAVDDIVNAATENSKCVFSSLSANVEHGVLAAAASPSEELAKNSALMVDSILRGTSVSEIPINEDTKTVVYISSKTASSLGIEVPTLENIITV